MLPTKEVSTDAVRIRELLLTNLFEVFSERDPNRRLNVIKASYTEDVIWSDPETTVQGHEALNDRAVAPASRHESSRERPAQAGDRD